MFPPIFRVNIKKYWNHHLGFFSNKKKRFHSLQGCKWWHLLVVFSKKQLAWKIIFTHGETFRSVYGTPRIPMATIKKQEGIGHWRPCAYIICIYVYSYLQNFANIQHIIYIDCTTFQLPSDYNHHVNFMTGNLLLKKHLGVCFLLNLDSPFCSKKISPEKIWEVHMSRLIRINLIRREGCPKELFFPPKKMGKFEAKN